MKKNKKSAGSQAGLQITLDPSLDRFSGVVLFKDKVEAAKKLLLNSPVPKEIFSA